MIIETVDIGDDEVLVYVKCGTEEFEMQDMTPSLLTRRAPEVGQPIRINVNTYISYMM